MSEGASSTVRCAPKGKGNIAKQDNKLNQRRQNHAGSSKGPPRPYRPFQNLGALAIFKQTRRIWEEFPGHQCDKDHGAQAGKGIDKPTTLCADCITENLNGNALLVDQVRWDASGNHYRHHHRTDVIYPVDRIGKPPSQVSHKGNTEKCG